jgi:hypothetical protein
MKMFSLNGKNLNSIKTQQTANSRVYKMTNLNVIRRTTAVNPVITTTKPEKCRLFPMRTT